MLAYIVANDMILPTPAGREKAKKELEKVYPIQVQTGTVSKALAEEKGYLRFAYTSSNRAKKIGDGNKSIAEYVNPRVFTNSDAIMNTRGKLYGWVSADFTSAAVAKAVWLNNYPEGGLEYASVSFAPPKGLGLPVKSYNMQVGTKISMPDKLFPSTTPQDKAFLGWSGTDGKLYRPGETITAKDSLVLRPRYGLTWALLQRAISNAPKGSRIYIELSDDVTATKADSALEVPAGADIELNLNGHTIDRAATTYTNHTNVFNVNGRLRFTGGGTITHGRGFKGGGIYVGWTGYVDLASVRITGNTAMISGAGIFVESREGATNPVVAIEAHRTTRVEGNTLDRSGNLNTSGNPSNVRLGKNRLIKGVEFLAADANAGVLGISTTKEPTGRKSVPVSTDKLDERYTGPVMRHLSNESKGFVLALDPTNRQVVITMPHTVTFKYGGASLREKRQVVSPFGRAEEPPLPGRVGYVFDGWYLPKDQSGSAKPYDFNTIVTKDLVLEAHWNKKRLTVSYDTDGGSNVPSQDVEYGDKATQPAAPTRQGHDFKGWTYSPEPTNPRI